uniref:Uncharacterized protein n=1 Tax=Solanum lycopersicum TaxID=4081 RepID=A0A3Q7GGR5_SOLLC
MQALVLLLLQQPVRRPEPYRHRTGGDKFGPSQRTVQFLEFRLIFRISVQRRAHRLLLQPLFCYRFFRNLC